MKVRKFFVELGGRSYPIYLGRGLLASLGSYCRKHEVPERVVILADRNSARVALRHAISALRKEGFSPLPIVMPAGERQKSLKRAEAVHSFMLRAQVPRRAALLALGGGVVGDVAGFVASTYRRGVMLLQCPTTLLSVVDSSVGGKNGVNLPIAKNAIGTFYQPSFVLSDVDLLPTLPRREIITGLGEVLKYPFVGDPDLLGYIEQFLEPILRVDPRCVMQVASRCLRIKTWYVSRDEKELLQRKGRVSLNFGHTIGHALETLSKYRLRHGEAVLLGIIGEGMISAKRGLLAASAVERLVRLYQRMGCRYNIQRISDRSIARFIFRDGKSKFVLPVTLGRVSVVNDVTERELLEGIGFLRAL